MCIYVPAQMSLHSVVAITPPTTHTHTVHRYSVLFLRLPKCFFIDLFFPSLFSSLWVSSHCFSHRKVTTEGQGLVKGSADTQKLINKCLLFFFFPWTGFHRVAQPDSELAVILYSTPGSRKLVGYRNENVIQPRCPGRGDWSNKTQNSVRR